MGDSVPSGPSALNVILHSPRWLAFFAFLYVLALIPALLIATVWSQPPMNEVEGWSFLTLWFIGTVFYGLPAGVIGATVGFLLSLLVRPRSAAGQTQEHSGLDRPARIRICMMATGGAFGLACAYSLAVLMFQTG